MKKIILGAVVAAVVIALPVAAQYVGGGSISGGGSSFSSIITTALNFSGLNPDIITPSGEDLTITPGSGGTAAKIVGAGGTGMRVETNVAGAAFDVHGATGAPTTPASACGGGHACIRVVGSDNRMANIEIRAGAANASGGGALYYSWSSATSTKQMWALKQESASLRLINKNETGGALNNTFATFYDNGSTAKGVLWGSTAQTCDCGTTGTPNTVTCNISSNFVILTDGDADDCTVTIADTFATTAAVDVEHVTIVVSSTGGGGTFNIAEVAGALRLESSTAWAGDAVGDNLTLAYIASGSVLEFVETGRRENM